MQDEQKFSVVTLNVDHNVLGNDQPDPKLHHTVTHRIKRLAPNAQNYMCTTAYDEVQSKLDFYSIPFVLVVAPNGETHELNREYSVDHDLRALIQKLSTMEESTD